MSEGFRVDGVPSLWERRYNLSSADSFLSSLDFPAMKTPSSDVLLPCTASLYRYFHYRSSLFLWSFTTISSLAFSSFLFSSSIVGFFFLFFGSATVPLAARESPLTRRMDDLRISSRSLSLVRSRYRSRSSVSFILSFSPSYSFRFSFFPLAVSPPIPRSNALIRLLRLVYRKDSVVVFCIAILRALTNESSAFGVAANK